MKAEEPTQSKMTAPQSGRSPQRNHWPLFWWQFRRILPVTIMGAFVATLFVLSPKENPQYYLSVGAQISLAIHSFLLVLPLGFPSSRESGFLYSQGFSRDSIWACTLGASTCGAIGTLIVPSLLLWTGTAFSYRTWKSGGQWQPPSDFNEMLNPVLWLAVYVFLVPLFHYAWIRTAQCSRDFSAGTLLALAGAFVLMFSGEPHWSRGWPPGFVPCVFACLLASTVIILTMSRHLHRNMEV